MNTSKERARFKFFETIKEYTPEVLSALETEVLPFYADWREAAGEAYDMLTMAFLPEAISQRARGGTIEDKRSRDFGTSLCAWARRYNLTDAWCIKEALETLELWQEYSDRRGDWSYTTERKMVNLKGSFRFEFLPYDETVETIVSYKKRATAAFKDWLDEYIENYRDQLNEPDETSDGQYRAYDYRKPIHFIWLVKHQVQGLRYEDIAPEYSTEEGIELGSMSEAITRLANLIGLTLRPAHGRPSVDR